MSTLLWSQKFLDKPSWCHRYMNRTLEQITGDIKGYGVKATSIEGQNDFAQNHALHKIYALINVKPGGRRGKRWEFFQKISLLSNSLNKTKCEDKTIKFTQLSLALILIFDLHDFQTVRCMSEVRNVWSVSVSFIRVRGQIYPRQAKKDSNIPYPRRTDQSNAPLVPQGQPPPHAVPPPQLYIDRCVTW